MKGMKTLKVQVLWFNPKRLRFVCAVIPCIPFIPVKLKDFVVCWIVAIALAELSTRQIAETMKATGMKENKEVGKKEGGIARKAISSKANDAGIAALVIQIKAEMEKMREQVQNVEWYLPESVT